MVEQSAPSTDKRPIVNLVLTCGDEVLLCLRSGHDSIDHQYHWAAPGGSAEPSEDLRFAAKREFYEEVLGKKGGVEDIEQKLPYELKELPVLVREDGRVVHTFEANITQDQKAELRIVKNWENRTVQWMQISDLPPVQRFHPDFVPSLNSILTHSHPNEGLIGERQFDIVPEGHIRKFHGGHNRIFDAQREYMYSGIGADADGSGFYIAEMKRAGNYVGITENNTGGWLHTIDFAFSRDECIQATSPKPLTEAQAAKLDDYFALENIKKVDVSSDLDALRIIERHFGSEKAREILYGVGIKGYDPGFGGDEDTILAFNPKDVTVQHVEIWTPPKQALKTIEDYQANRINLLREQSFGLETKIAEIEGKIGKNEELLASLGKEEIHLDNPGRQNFHDDQTSSSVKNDDLEAFKTVLLDSAREYRVAHIKYDDLSRRCALLGEISDDNGWDRDGYLRNLEHYKNKAESAEISKNFYEKYKAGLEQHYVPELEMRDYRAAQDEYDYFDLSRRSSLLGEIDGRAEWNRRTYMGNLEHHKQNAESLEESRNLYKKYKDGLEQHYTPELDGNWEEFFRSEVQRIIGKLSPPTDNKTYEQISEVLSIHFDNALRENPNVMYHDDNVKPILYNEQTQKLRSGLIQVLGSGPN